MTPAEYFDVAAAYKQLNDALWREKVDGDDGRGGNVRATALYHRLHDDLKDGGTLWLQRLVLGCNGLQWDPDNVPPATLEK